MTSDQWQVMSRSPFTDQGRIAVHPDAPAARPDPSYRLDAGAPAARPYLPPLSPLPPHAHPCMHIMSYTVAVRTCRFESDVPGSSLDVETLCDV
ncbi:MAG: hypothetical protein NZM94_15985, partial [Roseiflexus sp.]|nr:hypothetical protein [Roseiflexus sp.]